MNQTPDMPASWLGPSSRLQTDEVNEQPREFERLWRGFMTARVTLGVVLVLVQAAIFSLDNTKNVGLVLISGLYFGAALMVRMVANPRRLGRTFDSQWLNTIGADLLVFTVLHMTQSSSINYTPLFALPMLMASVLGSLRLAMGVAAGVTLLLFANAFWMFLQIGGDSTSLFLQAALTGAGCFVISFLANQIATRLADEEHRAQRNQLAVKVQQQVNELVIESLTDGVVVVDRHATVRAANPAARQLLGGDTEPHLGAFNLVTLTGWQGLVDLVESTFAQGSARATEVSIHPPGQGPSRVRAHTQLTTGRGAEGLCVMFLQDQREFQARMRTAKLASMGRMSAAVAHEIRNPLAAITQANALLDEDLSEPRHKQLTHMVQQNARRLEKIVADVLNIPSVRHLDNDLTFSSLDLNQETLRICRDWQAQAGCESQPHLRLCAGPLHAHFDAEHLRRILVNLLDNARRYASPQEQAIQVITGVSTLGLSMLSVWSDGPPMDRSVKRHLFEPFFSSESRSSGLGLYICREMCEGHGASIAYERTQQLQSGQRAAGNEFLVTFSSQSSSKLHPSQISNPRTSAWLHTLN